jgi:hypothetical protein
MTNVISNPADKLKIKKMLGEISDSYTRISAERELIKDTIEALAEDFEIEKKVLRKMAQVYHKQNFSTVEAEQEDFVFMYESILGTEE